MTAHLRHLLTTVSVPAVGSLLAIVVAGALAPAPGADASARPGDGIGSATVHTLTLFLLAAAVAALTAVVVAVTAPAVPVVGALVSVAARGLPVVIVASAAIVVAVTREGPVHPLPLGVVLAAPAGVAMAARLTDALTDEQRQTSVTMARTLGVAPRRLVFGRALPAAALRLVPAFAATLAWLAVAVLAAETLTGRSGLGPLTVDAIAADDTARLQVLAAVAVALVVAAWLLGSMARTVADPRVRPAERP
ncbi:ABC transporter permease subunit [Gordonia amarae]|uniref:ABC transporter permease subunit n=1 Tax=Gordonia amarae TaxID=36821 RepID=A0A857KS89_9ACTN|nr:ABC transporter permease subunit [Gordonia amarae]MCS3876787.1 ABC-type dipeptide/oligopeptide/nickel transport system permease component [Gordonia amarae]QHN15632.1 ABC transporter permease subunit [Gordonia amarae]QHN20201.1 ABC transporter permease subunit [Gordonia amarae]QHN29052.1 ABC transporter permease subunit [Gordonia amarae]QHN37833.1 ABC transporter permease subunit [Gordonia amarae]